MKKLQNKRKIVIVIIITVIAGGISLTNFFMLRYIITPNGYVPDAETAIRIAEAVWLPIYGEDIYDQQPFNATYNRVLGYWTVNGTLPEGSLGSVPRAWIRKVDGKVLFVIHF